jgi:hypothetical protein
MGNVIFTAEENSFVLEAEGKKLRVSYAEHTGNHESSMQFCKENGGGDETVENWRLIAKYRDAINKELAALGKDLIEGWYWTTELSWRYDKCAFVVDPDGGDVINEYRGSCYCDARAVSAFQ